MPNFFSILLASLLLTAAVAAQSEDRLARAVVGIRPGVEPQLAMQRSWDRVPDDNFGTDLAEGTLSFLYLPLVYSEIDVDRVYDSRSGTWVDADLDPGYGLGVRLGAEADGSSVGLMYVFATQDFDSVDENNKLHLGLFEYALVTPIEKTRVWQARARVGVGIGVGYLADNAIYDSRTGAAILLRGQGGIRYRRLRAELGIGAYAIPAGDLYGGFLLCEFAFSF